MNTSTIPNIINSLAKDPEAFCKNSSFRPPIQLEKIASLLNLEVSIGLPDSTSFEDLSYSGHVSVSDKGEGKIWINPFESEVRQRFTFAHEIGHYVLHLFGDGKKEFRDDAKTLRRGGSWNKDEYQANNFAAQLLMPEYLLLEYGAKLIEDYKKNNNGDAISVIPFVSSLAGAFNVSQAAMTYRLKNLKLIP